MSIFERELIEKIERGERMSEIARWWAGKIAKSEVEVRHEDLSPFERAFYADIRRSYKKWLQRRTLQ